MHGAQIVTRSLRHAYSALPAFPPASLSDLVEAGTSSSLTAPVTMILASNHRDAVGHLWIKKYGCYSIRVGRPGLGP